MDFEVIIEQIGLGGYSPFYWREDYPSYGNKNHAARMTNVDMTNPQHITQGPGLSNLTNGDQTGNVSTLIKGLLDTPVSSDSTYGAGGNKFYPISSTAVSAPTTIDHGSKTSESAEDVALYAGDVFISYNHSTGGDIAKYDVSETSLDPDWWTDVTTGTELSDNPHPMEVAGTSGVLYIGDGQYVKEWDGSTAYDDSFNTHDSDSVIVDLKWNQNRLWIAANKPNVSGSKNEASIYVWDGNMDSWEDQFKIKGEIGALFVKDSTLFVLYKKNVSDGVCTLAYMSGSGFKDLANYEGSLPAYYQVTSYKGFILWVSGSDIFAFGSGDVSTNPRIFQLASGGYDTVGGLGNIFGTPIVASHDGDSAYRLAEFSGYTTTASWKSLTFNIMGRHRMGRIDDMKFHFEKLASGAEVDITLKDNQGTTVYTNTISYSDDGAATFKDFDPKEDCENFRVELDWSDGSTTNPVKIKKIIINGHTLKG